jgi:RNA polymerase sigma-70 factor (ECF subfamily)
MLCALGRTTEVGTVKMSRSLLSLFQRRTDEESMRRVKLHDDHEEFARLVNKWEKPIWRLCTRLTGDPHRAEDLKQETFARLFQSRKQYEPAARFSTYLWRIAINLCRDEQRRCERRREFLRDPLPAVEDELAEDAPAESPGPDEYTAGNEEGSLVRRALLQLPEIYRTVLVLRHYEALKLSRIAEILDVPEGTVCSRLAEALQRMSRLLQPVLGPVPQKNLSTAAKVSVALPREKLVL